MTKCSFGFHKWNKWEYKKEKWSHQFYYLNKPIGDQRIKEITFGERNCVHCNKLQRKELRR